MDDLDRLTLEVAESIMHAERRAPGIHNPATVLIAKQILAQLQEAEPNSQEAVLSA